MLEKEIQIRLEVPSRRLKLVILVVQGGDCLWHMITNISSRTIRRCRCCLIRCWVGEHRQKRREKLLKALDEASRHYEKTNQKERQAFFHGLLTGYAVALKLL